MKLSLWKWSRVLDLDVNIYLLKNEILGYASYPYLGINDKRLLFENLFETDCVKYCKDLLVYANDVS